MRCAKQSASRERRWLVSAFLTASLGVATEARSQQPFSFGGQSVQPGSVLTGSLSVPGKSGDEGTTIPFTVVHGARPGPVLGLTAGVHGQEYAPIIALQRLRDRIDTKSLSGTVIMIHVSNMPSFLGRTIYYSPADRKNLNRVFPGSPDGTLSERIADVITTELIDRATHVVDLHCGDGNESLRPYTYWITSGTPEVTKATREMALAFGLDHIVVDRERPTDAKKSVYLSNTAITRGKPALTIESGALARTDEESIAQIERGVAGLLRHLNMRSEGPAPVAQPVYLTRSEVLTSGATGIFYPQVERGQIVTEGGPIGYVTDFHGKRVQEVRAPFAGQILYVIGTPPISKGEPLAFIGEVGKVP